MTVRDAAILTIMPIRVIKGSGLGSGLSLELEERSGLGLKMEQSSPFCHAENFLSSHLFSQSEITTGSSCRVRKESL